MIEINEGHILLDNKRCVLIADDDARILRSLKDFLQSKNFAVMEAADGRKTLDTFYDNNTKIDMILLDVMMPHVDGLSALKEIREYSAVPVIMLTAKGQEYDQLNGFKTGADDYIPKPFSPSLLLARMEAVFKRVGKNEASVAAGRVSVNTLKRLVTIDSSPLNLTPKEFDLLNYFLLNQALTVSREQILDAVWGYDFEGDERTVDTHVKQLRIKMDKYAGYIKTIHKVGYKFEVLEESNGKNND
jgi:DNA-binding response OmpR family regulator